MARRPQRQHFCMTLIYIGVMAEAFSALGHSSGSESVWSLSHHGRGSRRKA
ncbi:MULTISPECIES: hypothetical protein [Pseudomonas syringae group]|uniref:hypothetical protein n=1 Tax=Pseudomonas syringae group TaxID=136849 RepID=UPI00147BED60|nr:MULTISPECIES: hypothetical protein [Pseudomonas syringae group]MBX8521389.1 hypothetical protein [Pseudomonas cichorii]MBX8558356.1 hypothetical protein [Pseudomonas cichorii]MCK0550967.1 hypothetical protein [Pseudomonas syringae pv. aptata]